MTDRFIWASGSNTSPFDTWAKAATSTTTALTDVITASSAGDDIYMDAAFVISNGTAQTLTFKGTAASPNRLFSVASPNAHASPTTADLGTGAAHTTTGASNQTINGYVYIYGVTFNVGTGTTAVNFNIITSTNGHVTLDSCAIKMLVTTATCSIIFSGALNAKAVLINTPITFNGGAASGITVGDGMFIWKNTASAILGTQTAIANLFSPAGNAFSMVLCDSVDFNGGTGIASGKNLTAAANPFCVYQFINCKTTSGVLIGRPGNGFAIVDQIVTDSGATNYKQQRDMYQGTSTVSQTVHNNAVSDAVGYSLDIVTTANAKPAAPFECVTMPIWVAAGTYANSKVFITSATASLKTNDVWTEVQYLGSSYALGSPATTFGAGSGSATLPQIPGGTTPGTLASSSPAWGTGGLGNDYQLAIPSFTTSADGYVRAVVKIGKASFTTGQLSIDPAIKIAA